MRRPCSGLATRQDAKEIRMKETVPAFKEFKSAGKEQRDTQYKETETWEGPTNGAMSKLKEQKRGSWTPEECVKIVD